MLCMSCVFVFNQVKNFYCKKNLFFLGVAALCLRMRTTSQISNVGFEN